MQIMEENEWNSKLNKSLQDLNIQHTITPVGRHDGLRPEIAISRVWKALRCELTVRKLKVEHAIDWVETIYST